MNEVNAHWLDLLYVLTALCVVYKLAFIISQVEPGHSTATNALRICSAITGTLVVLTAVSDFQSDDAASVLDILRNLSWCGVLSCLIIIIRGKVGHW